MVKMDGSESSYSGWWGSARVALELGLSQRRVQQLYQARKLRGVLIGSPGRSEPIGRENNRLNGKVRYQQYRGTLELRIDPESVFELLHERELRARQIGERRIRRTVQKRAFFESHKKTFKTGWERDYMYHDDDQEPNG